MDLPYTLSRMTNQLIILMNEIIDIMYLCHNVNYKVNSAFIKIVLMCQIIVLYCSVLTNYYENLLLKVLWMKQLFTKFSDAATFLALA